MENAPNDTELDSDDEKDSERSKRRASNNSDRAVAVPREGLRLQPLKPGQEQEREKDSLWRRLIGSEPGGDDHPRTAERTEATEPAEPDSVSTPDLIGRGEQAGKSEDLPLTSLSPEEESLVLHRLVEADNLTNDEEPPADEEPAVTEAIGHFHDDILTGDKTLPEAFAGTLAWLEGDELTSGKSQAKQADIPQVSEHDIEPAEPRAPEAATLSSHNAEQDDPLPLSSDRRYDLAPNWPPNYTVAPAVEAPIATPVAEAVSGYNKSDVVGAALVGGLVGYLVGRRRGRIKTEKRLIPVQKKLEKQVKGLQEDIKKKESVIREKASEFARERQRLATPARGPAEKARERDLLRAAAAGELVAEQKPDKSRERLRKEHVEQPVVMQPEQQHIGQMLVTAVETLPIAAVELAESGRSVVNGVEIPRLGKEQPDLPAAEWASKPTGKARIERAPLVPIDKHVETLSQKDLLELSSKIIVDGTTLKQAFESHQVGERALRRMVSEHLRGGDVREALKSEVVEHEIDFERDPQLRDQGHPEPKHAVLAGGGQGLQALIKRADSNMGDDDDTADRSAVLATRAEHQAKRLAKQGRHHSQKHMIDAAMLGVIASLIGLIILLIISHS